MRVTVETMPALLGDEHRTGREALRVERGEALQRGPV
jgi:hypothetical protein